MGIDKLVQLCVRRNGMNLGSRSYVVVVGVSLVYLCILGFIHQGHPGTFITRGILVSSIIWCFSFSS